ncbi:glycosyltransferase [Halochromatium roseum]|uniref:glycosyltransferase n=1 Tax=Halochromatium roseum TaxID=391920 RepID=UPI00191154CB|nr:glycosyltransferase [Halochromatium roseum]MBK5938442.1 glycosyl transferase family 1 [Halochromatium roseum]
MNILFVHQNFPGQFKSLAPALEARGHRVVALGQNPDADISGGIELHTYGLERGQSPNIHPLAMEFEVKVIRAEAAARQAQALARTGFQPDVIIAHPGWGEALYLKDVFPRARLIAYAEFYYRATGQDWGFDPEFPRPDFDARISLHTKNANLCLAFESADQCIAPTHWQASTHPDWVRAKLQVIHDGIDTDAIQPNPKASMSIPSRKLQLGAGAELLTFVSRNLEPVRGYHRFIRALPEILRRRPRALAVIVGGGGYAYGARPGQGSYRQRFLEEVQDQLDPARVIMIDRLPHKALITLFQISRCHVYLTYPFVLSWSMLEAMSAGTLVVGSRTPPVEEVISDGENGYLADFFDTGELADKVCDALASPHQQASLGQSARRTISDRYDLRRCSLPALLRLIEQV